MINVENALHVGATGDLAAAFTQRQHTEIVLAAGATYDVIPPLECRAKRVWCNDATIRAIGCDRRVIDDPLNCTLESWNSTFVDLVLNANDFTETGLYAHGSTILAGQSLITGYRSKGAHFGHASKHGPEVRISSLICSTEQVKPGTRAVGICADFGSRLADAVIIDKLVVEPQTGGLPGYAAKFACARFVNASVHCGGQGIVLGEGLSDVTLDLYGLSWESTHESNPPGGTYPMGRPGIWSMPDPAWQRMGRTQWPDKLVLRTH